MPRTNDEVAAALNELADLLQIRGTDRFRITSYRRAADAISSTATDVATLDDRELTAIRGVGKSVAAKVREYVESGRIAALEDLRTDVPAGVREMTGVPGLGPKRAMQLHRELGISSVDELREAAEAGRLEEVAGFGPKAQENLLRALDRYTGREERVLLGRAIVIAEGLVAEVSQHRAVERCAYAGSLRRMRETIGDIDILVASDRPEELAEAFGDLEQVERVVAHGETKTSIVTGGLQVDLRVVPPPSFGAAMQYFTGSKEHNVKVREHAVRRGWKLSEYGLFEGDDVIASETEDEIYSALGMPWIPPTMREDRGEVEAALAGELPEVVAIGDLRGDLQSHSTYSDGRTSVREMAFAAADRGYAYFAVTDHGRDLRLKSLSTDDIERQREEVRAVDEELGGRMTLLHGVELNISPDGGLDYPDDVLAGFDVVVASVHSHFDLPADRQTRRLVRAIANPHVHIVGHPTGRRLDRRPGIDLTFEPIFEACIEHRVALEVNAHPWRLDLRDEHVRWAVDAGVPLVISTDAHSPAELDNMRFGVATAQRGWATPDDVINTRPLGELRTFLGKS